MKQSAFSDRLATYWMNTSSADAQSAVYALPNLDLKPDLNLESLHACEPVPVPVPNCEPRPASASYTHGPGPGPAPTYEPKLDLHPLVNPDLHLHLIHMNMDLDPLMNPGLHLDPQLDPMYLPSIQLNGTVMLPLRTSVGYGILALKQHRRPCKSPLNLV